MIQALVNLINEPEPDHPLRGDLAEEYSKDKKKFMKNAGKRVFLNIFFTIVSLTGKKHEIVIFTLILEKKRDFVVFFHGYQLLTMQRKFTLFYIIKLTSFDLN